MADEHTPKFISYPEDLNWSQPEEVEELGCNTASKYG